MHHSLSYSLSSPTLYLHEILLVFHDRNQHHTDYLLGIVKHIDGLDTEQIQKIGIPNGIPLVYKFDRNMKPIVQPKAVAPLSGEYLEKKVRLDLLLALL